MNIGQNPEILDRLAASYALGTLRGGARRRLETLARQSATVRARVLLWQERMNAMIELPEPVVPSPNVWKRIENALILELDALRKSRSLLKAEGLAQLLLDKSLRAVSWWRGAAWVGALATVAAVVVGLNHSQEMQGQLGLLTAKLKVSEQSEQVALRAVQQLSYVAVLSDNASTASVLVTIDVSKNKMTLQRVGAYQEAVDKSLQLWAIPAGGKPQSLGVMGNEKVSKLAADVLRVKGAPILAVSLEPKGGVSEATGPTGPVLFKGALIETAL